MSKNPGKRPPWIAILGVIGVLVISAAGALIAAAISSSRERTRVLSEATPGTQPMTMNEVLTLANTTVASWGDGWAIVSVSSSDAGDKPTAESGRDGKRLTWQTQAVGPKGELRTLMIIGGSVTSAIAPTTKDLPGSGQPGLHAAALDSPELVRRGAEAASLVGADEATNGKALGWHFHYAIDSQSRKPVVTVLGAVAGLPARADLQPDDGQLLRRQILSVNGGALWASLDAGVSWKRASFASGSPSKLATGQVSGKPALLAVLVESDHLALWSSLDGESWQRVSELPKEAGNWARGMTFSRVTGQWLLATTGGLWSFDSDTSAAAREDVSGPVIDLLSTNEPTDYVLVVREPGVTELYRRTGTSGWTRQESGAADRLAATGTTVRLLASSTALRSGAVNATSLAGEGQRLVSASNGHAMHSADGGSSWSAAQGTGAADIVLVASDPRFGTNGIALAAAFRGGVYRTSDFGQHWQSVPGPSGEPGALVFLTSQIAACVEGGALSWSDF